MVRSEAADDTACAIYRERRQNKVCIEYGNDDLDTKPYRRRQIYRRIRFIELGFREVDSGNNRDTD
jgi:hypothetical protein